MKRKNELTFESIGFQILSGFCVVLSFGGFLVDFLFGGFVVRLGKGVGVECCAGPGFDVGGVDVAFD